ncbi:MAG: bifunctional diaminohydroxyphosphoribosylaminopyrimidine deaminase/5-amino-6-(5-phosphoribosylamino)uracil reductase RibD [Pirellulales bacterium]|nr:bifunctional diaminohydroxyphosphoribosylaminopyrimidine deaminase/5-amino-6-(5-phosphoribosylamino)uracil reductase RibD [Pirellulales bacterium]
MDEIDLEVWHMRRALELAAEGLGRVEPNPMVGCVIVRGAEIIGEGWHRQFGGPHAEIEALRLAGPRAAGATMIVTLEPCCHHGKTPPCADAVIAAGIRRVVVAQRDPFPQVDGGGIAWLEAAGVEVRSGVLEDDARRLNAPYLKLIETGRPWVIAKWAMTLCGKTATRTGRSRWISCEASREIVHALRGRVDAILVGRGTALADDPLLLAQPPGPRTALRVVLDSRATLPSNLQLVRTARDAPVLIAAGPDAPAPATARLSQSGCEVFVCDGATREERLDALLIELGRRRMTNVLVEGGGQLVGSLLDAGQIDEVHAFIAPKLFGSAEAPSPVAGAGVAEVAAAAALDEPTIRQVGSDVYVFGRTVRPAS